MKLLLFILTVVSAFYRHPFQNRKAFHMSPKDPLILDPMFIQELIAYYDSNAFENYIKNNIPRFPETEDEIEEDSFEGYLRNHFLSICDDYKEVDFEIFYKWRYYIGTVLTKEEISSIYYTIVEEQMCNVIEFIKINIIIDENDGADYN